MRLVVYLSDSNIQFKRKHFLLCQKNGSKSKLLVSHAEDTQITQQHRSMIEV